MKKYKKLLIAVIIIVVISGVLFLYFSQTDWCKTQGWSGSYNKDSYTMKGIQGLEIRCIDKTRIIYSYAIVSGGVELKITSDRAGEDIAMIINVTKDNCEGIITFEDIEPGIYYLHATALSKDSEYVSEGSYEINRSKWEQLILDIAFHRGIDMEYFI